MSAEPDFYFESLPLHGGFETAYVPEEELLSTTQAAWNDVLMQNQLNQWTEDQVAQTEHPEELWPPEIQDAWLDVMGPEALVPPPAVIVTQKCAAPLATRKVVPVNYFFMPRFVERHCQDMQFWQPSSGPFVTLKYATSDMTLTALLYLMQWMGYNRVSAAQIVFQRLIEPQEHQITPRQRASTRVKMSSVMLRHLKPELTRALLEQGIGCPEALTDYWRQVTSVATLRWPHIIYLIVYMVFLADERRRGEPNTRANRNAKRRSQMVLMRCVNTLPLTSVKKQRH